MPKGVLRPLQQGHVDGMCGVYSVMNACNLLLDDPLADENKQFDRDEAFFTALCRKVLPRFPNIVYDGVEGDGVELVIDGAKHWLAKKEKRKLVFSQPVLRKPGGTVKDFFEAMRDAMAADGKNSAYIIGIDKPWDHWSVVRKVGKSTVTFFDSWGFPSEKNPRAGFDEFTFDKKAPGVADYMPILIDPRWGCLLTLE